MPGLPAKEMPSNGDEQRWWGRKWRCHSEFMFLIWKDKDLSSSCIQPFKMRDSQETRQPSDRRPWRCSPDVFTREDIEIDFYSSWSTLNFPKHDQWKHHWVHWWRTFNELCTYLRTWTRRVSSAKQVWLSELLGELFEPLTAFGWGCWAFWLSDEVFGPFGFWMRMLSLSSFEWGFWR